MRGGYNNGMSYRIATVSLRDIDNLKLEDKMVKNEEIFMERPPVQKLENFSRFIDSIKLIDISIHHISPQGFRNTFFFFFLSFFNQKRDIFRHDRNLMCAKRGYRALRIVAKGKERNKKTPKKLLQTKCDLLVRPYIAHFYANSSQKIESRRQREHRRTT